MNRQSRRTFLTGTAAGTGMLSLARPQATLGQQRTLRAGVIGVGGRGREAAVDFLQGSQNTEVVALADIFEDQLEKNLAWMTSGARAGLASRVRVDATHRFVGFDAYQKLMSSDVDIVMLATPPGYRPAHFEAAVNAGKHIFCEKPVGTDAAGVRRFMDAARRSEEKKLSVVSGAQRRFNQEYVQTVGRIQAGAIGEVTAAYAYWVGAPVIQQKARDPKWGDMTWQHRAWYSFVWICGDQVVEQHFHNIDVINWVMGMHPERVVASGGAAWRPRTEIYGNIYDHVVADFVYPNGVRMSSYCRQYPDGLYRNTSELVVGTRGRTNCHDMGTPGPRDYVAEHTALVNSIRGEGPYINHAMQVAETTMTCIMARESAYSGLEITWDMIMNSKQDLQPKAFGYDEKMEVPPLPVPGEYKFV